jgi:ubiquinone/menaquinone biosynthesis C-methylase UbiE
MSHSHPIIAAIYDRMSESEERAFLARLRSKLLASATGTVVEVGAGTGRNLPYYRPEVVREVVAVEPDPHMTRRAQPRLAAAQDPVRPLDATAERLPLDDGFADTVVATLVLCSVDDPEKAVREIHRVLKPGGTLLFIEHIRSEEPWRMRLQDFLTPA